MTFESFALQFIQEDAKHTQNDGAKWNTTVAPLYDRLRAAGRKQDGEVIEPIDYSQPVMAMFPDHLPVGGGTGFVPDVEPPVKKERKKRAKKESKTSDSVG